MWGPVEWSGRKPRGTWTPERGNNDNNLRLSWLRQTAQPYIRYTTYNSLPRRAAMTYTLSHRTATTRFSPDGRLPETNGAKCCQQSDQVGPYRASIHQMAPPKRGGTHLMIALLLMYRPQKDERLSWPGWLTCSGRFAHIVVTRRLQAERRTGPVRRPKTGVPPTVLRNQPIKLAMKQVAGSTLAVFVFVFSNVTTTILGKLFIDCTSVTKTMQNTIWYRPRVDDTLRPVK